MPYTWKLCKGWCQIRRNLKTFKRIVVFVVKYTNRFKRIWQRRAKLQCESIVERVETRRHPSKSSNGYDEGIVQGVVKATQTGILWSQVQVLVGPPEKQTLIRNGGGFVFIK